MKITNHTTKKPVSKIQVLLLLNIVLILILLILLLLFFSNYLLYVSIGLTVCLLCLFSFFLYHFRKSYNTDIEKANEILTTYYASILGIKELPKNTLSENLYEFCNQVYTRYVTALSRTSADLLALQSQINPHFLYNTLDSIRGLAVKYKAYKISDMTQALSSLFRYTISKKAIAVPLREELWNISTYFKIQQFRFNDRFTLNVDGDFEALDCYIPKMTLQPIVENAIFHGIEVKKDYGNVYIRYNLTKKRLIITISDDGAGISPDTLKKITASIAGETSNSEKSASDNHTGTGIALSNIDQRIKLIYGKKYGLSISSIEGVGTDVEITFPVNYKNPEATKNQ